MKPESFNLILLSAWHEQGGNLTHRHFDGHPNLFTYPTESQLATPQSNSIMDDSFVRNRYRYPEFLSEITPRQAYQSIWDEELKTYLRTPHKSKFKDCGLIMDESKRIEAFHKYALTDNGDRPSRADYVEAFFRATFDTWENYKRTGNETHYVGYSPPIHFNADKFFADFPNGHMVHVIRNPYSGYADTLKRPFTMGAFKYASVWSAATSYALQLAQRYPLNFHIVHLESLLEFKEETMRSLCTKLGIPFSDTMLYPSFNGQKLDSIYPWGHVEALTIESNKAAADSLDAVSRKTIQEHTSFLDDYINI